MERTSYSLIDVFLEFRKFLLNVLPKCYEKYNLAYTAFSLQQNVEKVQASKREKNRDKYINSTKLQS